MIYTDTIHNAILFVDTSAMFDTTLSFFNGKPILAIIASNYVCGFLSWFRHGFMTLAEVSTNVWNRQCTVSSSSSFRKAGESPVVYGHRRSAVNFTHCRLNGLLVVKIRAG